MKANQISGIELVAIKFKTLCTFTARKRVDSEAFTPDRRLCMPGDKITVVRWHCHMGPTDIIVEQADRSTGHYGGEHCIPFGWVMEMGAPEELSTYMPFAPRTWEEILAEK